MFSSILTALIYYTKANINFIEKASSTWKNAETFRKIQEKILLSLKKEFQFITIAVWTLF